MAKERQRGNREVRKPKAPKPSSSAASAATASPLTLGSLTPLKLPKQKR